MIVRYYLTSGQQIDARAPEPEYPSVDPYALHEVEKVIADELGGITVGDYGSRRQVRPPACVTVTLMDGTRQILMTAHILCVKVLED